MAVVAALIPVLIALLLLGSAARGRLLLGRQRSPAQVRTLTITWGSGLFVIGLLQGATAIFANMSVTNPTDVLIRTLASLALEGLIFAATKAYLRRSDNPATLAASPPG